ncbi:6-phosphofructokinase [Lachnospira multipara]|uniref:6-phosphofructokinase n=1 Tax=Lachnospira multipara TaxID=28051 RepID=UPI00048956B8|nr:6-phosphofructokinase [Lachnospira multipara]
MKNAIIAQSGGPTVAINASLAGVLNYNIKNGIFENVYGSLNGITGILEDRFINLSEKINEIDGFVEKLVVTPAMYLGSCRYKMPLPEDNKEIYEKIFDFFKKHDIDAFFYIGGNDSMDTVDRLSKYAASINSDVRVIGIPKTIDNDLVHIDHTPGFGSAAKYVATSILEMAHDTYIYHVKSVTIVEIMGRDAGWLTAASALARNEYSKAPHLIYLPEAAFDAKECVEDVKALLEKQDDVIIAISEGIRDKDGNYFSASESKLDKFGHVQLSGAGKALEHLIANEIGCKVRSVELNILQRCATHQASLTDLEESVKLGEKACELAKDGKTGLMATITRTSDKPYEVVYGGHPVCEIANGVKAVPREWINERGNDVTEEMLTYLKPLIKGEAKLEYVDGLPQYLDVTHLINQ